MTIKPWPQTKLGQPSVLPARPQENEKFSLADASVNGNGVNPDFRQAGWEKMRDAIYGDFA